MKTVPGSNPVLHKITVTSRTSKPLKQEEGESTQNSDSEESVERTNESHDHEEILM